MTLVWALTKQDGEGQRGGEEGLNDDTLGGGDGRVKRAVHCQFAGKRVDQSSRCDTA
jgi:hypothetical protein